jgi:hypothetical protein
MAQSLDDAPMQGRVVEPIAKAAVDSLRGAIPDPVGTGQRSAPA